MAVSGKPPRIEEMRTVSSRVEAIEKQIPKSI
jgi:hypothetical protein